MPSVVPPSKVLVTGANGYVALHIVNQLLEDGYAVRGTVRSTSKGEWMKSKFASFGAKFEYSIVEDISKEGAFDEALKGVDAVLHTATPIPDNWIGTYESVYLPAVNGTRSIFNSIRITQSVKRIVFTSSFAAVGYGGSHEPPHTYSEEDWNDEASQAVKERPHQLSGLELYLAAKTDAERTAWQFYHDYKAEAWDLVSLCPPFVFGPFLQEEPNLSIRMLYDKALKEKPADQSGLRADFWIDARDCAKAHILALQKGEAGGERFFVTAGPFKWIDIYEPLQSLNIPEIPQPMLDDVVYDIADTSKASRILGLEYRNTFGDCARETITAVHEYYQKKE
ncbi:NAD(P)-binding protein [Calocera cornea HHB12733]|uniref:NAD(P)-binding protein n=1 Tax=Calocera cornea HHB12733 TaxID=1353952 RepID=A0A165CHR3_9BASI|nr:NAD(P)-binding protein [Calocera cornea HHB12733]